MKTITIRNTLYDVVEKLDDNNYIVRKAFSGGRTPDYLVTIIDGVVCSDLYIVRR